MEMNKDIDYYAEIACDAASKSDTFHRPRRLYRELPESSKKFWRSAVTAVFESLEQQDEAQKFQDAVKAVTSCRRGTDLWFERLERVLVLVAKKVE